MFLGVLKGIGTFHGTEDGFRSWVFSIAHRRVVNDRRRRGRRPLDLHEPGAAVLKRAAEGDASSGTEGLLAEARVLRLCEQLVPDQRAVLLLRLVGDLTVEQVAEALEKTPGAVKQLQRRGLAAIRRLLDQEGATL